MRIENFIYFFTISGFFIGLIFSIINFNAPENILFYTLLITLFFYLLIHLIVANTLDIKNISKKIFNKEKYEEVSDYFIYELENREEKINLLVGAMEDFSINKSKKQKRNINDNTSQIAA